MTKAANEKIYYIRMFINNLCPYSSTQKLYKFSTFPCPYINDKYLPLPHGPDIILEY